MSFDSLIMMFLDVDLLSYLKFFSFLDMFINTFSTQFEKLWSFYSKYSFFSFPLPSFLLELPLCACWYIRCYLTSSKFCSFLFFSYFSDWVISINLSSCLLIISSGCSNYLLASYHEIFISIVIISAPEILFLLFLGVKKCCWCSVFGDTQFSVSVSSSDMVSFSLWMYF